MKILKTKTLCFGVVGIFSLILGLLIYILFRGNAIITTQFSKLIDLTTLRSIFSWAESDFLKYYLVDFLWALSLSCGLHIIFVPKLKGSIICSFVVVAFGTIFELLQLFNLVNGTGDIIDVTLYLLAAIVVNIINFKKGEVGMRKIWSLLLAAILLCVFLLFALGSTENNSITNSVGGSVEENTVDTTDNIVGDYAVDVKECRLANGLLDGKVVIVKYGFTNNSDDAQAFDLAVNCVVYQNGVELTETWNVDDSSGFNRDDQMKRIKSGATFDLEVAYKIEDTVTDIEIEIKDASVWGSKDDVINKTLSIK